MPTFALSIINYTTLMTLAEEYWDTTQEERQENGVQVP